MDLGNEILNEQPEFIRRHASEAIICPRKLGIKKFIGFIGFISCEACSTYDISMATVSSCWYEKVKLSYAFDFHIYSTLWL